MSPWELDAAAALAADAGVHGIYVRNWLLAANDAGERDGDAAEVLLLHGARALLGLCFFGARGNLVVLESEPLDALRLVEAIAASGWSWRIALARKEIVAALRARDAARPLVHRDQIYYGAAPSELRRDLVRSDVRAAVRADAPALVAAALELNHADLGVEPHRVNKAWLADSIERRIAERSTHVIGPIGRPLCKLDLGSVGAAGIVLEGVFTVREARGAGLAAGIVATVGTRIGASLPRVSLHVGADNEPARRAYERAGLVGVDRCMLLLRG